MRFILSGIKKLIIPTEENSHHPIAIRNYSLFFLTITLMLLNFVLAPYFQKARASNINVEGIIEITNQKRIENGISPLIRNHLLEKAALAKLKDMFEKQYWDHYGPNGETPWGFIKEAGYNYVVAGENLARDFVDLDELINAWMNSPTHRANILNKNYNEIGVAVATGNLQGRNTTLIVQLFGSRISIKYSSTYQNDISNRIEDYKPIIKNPQNNQIFNNPKIQVSGESTLGDFVNIYLNNQLIQTTPINGNNFTLYMNIIEGENNISVQSTNSRTNRYSQLSDPVTIFLDTQPINIEKLIFNAYTYKDKYLLVIDKIDDLNKITLQFNNNQEQNLDLYGNLFISQVPQNVEIFKLNFYDRANNKLSKEFTKSELLLKSEQEIPNFILGYISTNDYKPKNGLTLDIFNNESNPVKMLNTFILFVLVLFILIDAIILIRKGHFRYHTSNHSINLPVIFLGLIILLFL